LSIYLFWLVRLARSAQLVFLTLLIATVETALIFFAQQTLQTAATNRHVKS